MEVQRKKKRTRRFPRTTFPPTTFPPTTFPPNDVSPDDFSPERPFLAHFPTKRVQITDWGPSATGFCEKHGEKAAGEDLHATVGVELGPRRRQNTNKNGQRGFLGSARGGEGSAGGAFRERLSKKIREQTAGGVIWGALGVERVGGSFRERFSTKTLEISAGGDI